MHNFKHIQVKLQNFIKKFYFNELIKGLLLFFAIGLLYFIFTLLIEHFLWLKPIARTVLFWIFLLVEVALFTFYIIFPIGKIIGLKKGITNLEASRIIGNHFPEIQDKLLNMLQLQGSKHSSELLEASIEQKSKELEPIPFRAAVNFSKNKKFIKYTVLPILIWFFVYITGNSTIFNNSFSRVVHYNTQFEPPAPFSFIVLNKSLNVIEGEAFTLKIETLGNIAPEDVKINFLNESYYVENLGIGKFQYVFNSIKKPINFYLKANGITSKSYQINSIATPVITNIQMVLNYPNYTGKKDEIIKNTGNAIVPQGTKISWQIETHQTNTVSFHSNTQETENFTQSATNYFSYSKQVFRSINYKIATSNKLLTNYESLNFTVQVISDENPRIIVKSDIDSISRGPAQFIGQIRDDYGVSKLQLVYYNKANKKEFKTHQINISKATFSDFYYVFPDGILMEEGIDYELYFEVFDNDVVNGNKKTKSRIFSYYNKTKKEVKEELLKEQKETISNIAKTLEKSKKSNSEVQKFKETLQKKATINWNETKKLEALIKRQTQYQEMSQKQTNKLSQNLNEQNEQPESKDLKEKKEELQKRIEETKKMANQEKLLEELKELSKKLEKEDLVKKLKELAKKNKQNEQSLERILELTKRFYVEQKANQISEKLNKLAEKEKELSKESEQNNTAEKQQKINNEFNEIKKDFNELNKQNEGLKRPMKFPNNEEDTNDIDKELENALQELKKQQSAKAKKNQKSASQKMKELSKSMEQSLNAMGGESIDENIEDLRKIVENLIEFSFQQEDLLTKFSNTDNHHPEYSKNIKQQHVLKEYFEHIDDSLYVLSLRLVKMSSAIQKEVSDAHYYIDESLLNFTENRFQQGVSNQHFVITAANNLANSLSNLLESLMNASPSFGKGKGSSKGFSLPDIIKKQGELTKKMKDGVKNGEKQGKNKGNKSGNDGEQMNGELYEIYKQQAQLREMLNEILGTKGEKLGKGSGDAVKQMEALEKELLEKGFTQQMLQKMQQLNYELLKLEKAKLQQGEDTKRTSKTNIETFQKRRINKLKLQNQYFNYNEILNRQSLPLRTIYKKKVQEYFKTKQ